MKTSIIIPAYKEAANMEPLITRISNAMKSLDHEIIVVDDNSKDGTAEIMSKLEKKFKCKLITRTTERGLSSAVLTGFKAATGDNLICMDADLQHPPESLPSFVEQLKSKEFVIGTRYASGKMDTKDWPLYRQIISKAARALALPLTSLTDPMTGYFGIHANVLERGTVSPIGFKIAMEIYVKCKVNIHAEVPIEFGVRTEGESKLSSKVIVNYLKHLMQLYWFKYQAILMIIIFLFVVIGYQLLTQ